MFQILLISIFIVSALVFSLAVRRRKFPRNRKRMAAEERSLWGGLAAGLFDSDDCPATARLEIALAAIASKLKVRSAMITVHQKESCRVVAISNPAGLSGPVRGEQIARNSIYCGSLLERGQCLAINYASLSEWRRHLACHERGWESYIGVNCGLQEGAETVIAFFDSIPREAPFSLQEKSLIRQLVPWVAAMLGEKEPAEIPISIQPTLVPTLGENS